MKLDSVKLRSELIKIMDEEGLSAQEVASLCGIAPITVYRIIEKKAVYVQRAIGRKLAEGLGRTFKIHNDRIEFIKAENKTSEKDSIKAEIIGIYDSLSEADKIKLRDIIKTIWAKPTATQNGRDS